MVFAVVQVNSHAAAALLMRLLSARPAAARTEAAKAGSDFTQCPDAVIRRMRIRRRSAVVTYFQGLLFRTVPYTNFSLSLLTTMCSVSF